MLKVGVELLVWFLGGPAAVICEPTFSLYSELISKYVPVAKHWKYLTSQVGLRQMSSVINENHRAVLKSGSPGSPD